MRKNARERIKRFLPHECVLPESMVEEAGYGEVAER